MLSRVVQRIQGTTSALVPIPCCCSAAADPVGTDEGFTFLKKQLLYYEHHCPLKGKGVVLLPLLLLPLALQSPAKAVAELLF